MTENDENTMSGKTTEQAKKVRVEVLIENLYPRIETFDEIFAKRKRLREEAHKAKEENMKRANPIP